MKKNILICSLIFLISACNIKEQSEIQKEVLASDEIISISADSLLSNFYKDSTAATEMYMDKVLSIHGTVGIFEQLDTIKFNRKDSLPYVVNWLLNRIESDINTSNVIFKSGASFKNKKPGYSLSATFPKEYRRELAGIKEESNITVKGKLEHISVVSSTQADSTKKAIAYILSLQGCVLDTLKHSLFHRD
ncbi:MAG: hypothetical protein J7604_18615 [Sporocytophaga sp.]|uniref:OB-fold protein n=1 Tax=Sporocytophaga sp. TaxID=2231183 RepID=UPI001B038698|nr:hypothetical protein [Sporocytophaga sp.]MBO9702229.1 hypothetical protein [Sporocytophaga sp.]